MRGRGKKPGYNTGSGHISILSKDFNVSGTVRASTLTTSTINCIDTVLNTSNNLYVQDAELYLNGKPIKGLDIDPYELTIRDSEIKEYVSYSTNTTFTVPPGVSTLEAQVWGAGGGYYGNGAYIHISAEVKPGDVYEVVIGPGGIATMSSNGAINTNGKGGGGDSIPGYFGGGSGGGYTGIIQSELASTILVIAGGGGSASYGTITGLYSHAGITAGYPGGPDNASGRPGTQTAGGQGGVPTSTNGAFGRNGTSYSSPNLLSGDGGESIRGNGGGGGGDGYYAGGGGAGNGTSPSYFGGGGGGGSSYINSNTSVIKTNDGSEANIYALEEYYEPGVGMGGTYYGTNGLIKQVTSGGPGLVVFSYYLIKDLWLTSPYDKGRFISKNIQAISTITENLTFNTQKPIRIYADNNDRYVFEAVGTEQTFTVPNGVTNLNVKLWGAAGFGLGPSYGMGLGGYGGYVSGSLPVTPGQELTIIVGSQGSMFSDIEDGSRYGIGGFGGGGNGGFGGGGRSAIQGDGEELVTAGGGGAASPINPYAYGGAGGNYTGQSGILYTGYTSVGQGGTQTAGGVGGISVLGGINAANYQGNDGTNYTGGDGAFCSSIASFISTSGGGGGGGYYGGGGGGGHFLTNAFTSTIGAGRGGSGGGGSSFLSNLVNSVGIPGNYYTKYMNDPDYIQGAGLSDGLVIISYPANLQVEYTDPLARIGVNQAKYSRNGWLAGGYGTGNYGLQWSYDGINWNPINSGGFAYNTRGIAFNQSNWVAVGTLSSFTTDSVNSIQTSLNGTDWIEVTSGGFSNGHGVIWGNGIWVAVGEQLFNTGGSIQISKDGMNWSNTSNTFPTIGYGIAYNTISKLYVAVGNNDYSKANTILYSKDAKQWITSLTGGFINVPQTPIYNTYYPGSNGLGVATNNLGSLQQVWVAVGSYSTSNGTIQYSRDGENWSNVTRGGFVGFGRGVAYANGLWIAVGDTTYLSAKPLQTIQWSLDGLNWYNAVSGGFAYSGTSVAYNGKTWIATGLDTEITGCIQNSTDGSNWQHAELVQGSYGPDCIAQGILNISQNNYTFLTNSQVITETVNTTNANVTGQLTANYLTSPSATIEYAQLNYANVSNLTANYGSIGDIYPYSQVINMIYIQDNFNIAVAIGNSEKGSDSIQITNDNLQWNSVFNGGFLPIITYSKTRIITSSLPKAFLYKYDSSMIVAYGLTNDAIYSNDFSGTIQYGFASNPGDFSNYTGSNTLNTFILENLNNALYTQGRYLLLTSIAESPILTSKNMGTFYVGKSQNAITYSNFHSTVPASTLSAAYGFYSDGSKTYVVGTANGSYTANGNSPIFFTNDGSNFYMPYSNSGTTIQANMPPTFYGITKDTNTGILFMVGPGIPNGNTSLSTCMYSVDDGVIWLDTGLEGVISARAVSWGSNPTGGKATVLIACEATSSSNTIITYSYTNLASFSPYVGNTLSSNVISLLYSSSSGSNFISSATYGFDKVGYGVTYDGSSTWYAVGSGSKTILKSLNGSNWSAGPNSPIDIAAYGVLTTSPTTLYVVGSSTVPGNTVCYGNPLNTLIPISSNFDNVGYGIAYSGSLIVAVGQGRVSGTILYTNNTINLSNTVRGAFDIAGYGIAYGNGIWIATGKSSATSNILYSTNGSNWSNANHGFDIQGQGVVYRNVSQSTLWVAVGQGIQTSNILYSSDGSNWFNAVTPTFTSIGYSVTWDGVKNFVAVGDSGILYSPDGSNWSRPTSGDFRSQSNIVGTGTIIVSDSVGRGVVSNGAGRIVVVGAASNTNRRYNWSNINSQDLGLGTPFTGFSSILSEDGLTLKQTYVATTAVYNPIQGGFLVGGLTNDTKTCIVSDYTDGSINLNIWKESDSTSFTAKNELQFMNSCNRSVVAKDITTDLLYASNGYVSKSLFITNTTTTDTLNASKINSSNINTSNLTSQFISTNSLNTGQLNVNSISTTLISSAHIRTSSITVNAITVASHVATNAVINTISSVHTTASFFYGDGINLSNLTANNLVDKGGLGYNIPNTNIIANNITGNFIGNFSGTVNTSATLSDTTVLANTINVSTITTYGNINMIGTNGVPGIISGNGSGLSNVTASNLRNNVNHTIGTGTFTAAAFIGNGAGLTNLTNVTSALTANYATQAGSASNASNAGHATTASGANVSGFISQGEITSYGGFRSVASNGDTVTLISDNITTSGNMQGATITAIGGFVGDGSRLTGIVTRSPYMVSQGNVRYNAGIRTFSGCFIPKGLGVYSILKVIVGTRPDSGSGSYHIAEIILKGAEQQYLTFLSDTITGDDFLGETIRAPGDNALTVPSSGIYFIASGGIYTLAYNGDAPDYTYGMYGVIQQQV